MICTGCSYADAIQNRYGCPFCRAPLEHFADSFVLLNKRIEVNDPEAFYEMGSMYSEGYNIAQDKSKALEYYIRGATIH
jgi:TPR repeat protein